MPLNVQIIKKIINVLLKEGHFRREWGGKWIFNIGHTLLQKKIKTKTKQTPNKLKQPTTNKQIYKKMSIMQINIKKIYT